jgi:8-oxo-dGTP pyrophosphatase MutT (NUDIX family)
MSGAREYLSDLRQAVGSRPLIVAGACVIVRDEEGRVLLQHRCDDGTWDLVGGSMEPGETFEQTVRREAREEIGVEIGALEMLEVYSGRDFFHKYPNGDEVYHIGVAFLTHDFRGTPQPDKYEVDEVGFFSIDSLPAAVKRSALLRLEHLGQRERS